MHGDLEHVVSLEIIEKTQITLLETKYFRKNEVTYTEKRGYKNIFVFFFENAFRLLKRTFSQKNLCALLFAYFVGIFLFDF